VERRKRRKRKSRKTIYGILAVAVVFFCILTYSFLHPKSQININRGSSYKAAIVDHLSLSAPNQTFIQTATNTLEKAGYTVDYYPGEEVNVELHRNLPTRGYDLIVLRVHSALKNASDPPLCLFTSQPYSNEYLLEQLTDRIGRVSFIVDKPPFYFGILPNFIRSSMNGRFENTIIIMMGCNGLTYTKMAEALIEKGAKAYISWNEKVSASHTDKATIHLLQKLTIEKQTIKQAVTETMEEVGPDPIDGSTLQYYPDSVDNYFVPNIAGNSMSYHATISGYDSSFILSMFIVPDVEK